MQKTRYLSNDFTPADQFDVKGTYVSNRSRKEGVGATLVAVGRGMNEDALENFGMAKTYYGVTAVARFEGRRCTIAFEDPLSSENDNAQRAYLSPRGRFHRAARGDARGD